MNDKLWDQALDETLCNPHDIGEWISDQCWRQAPIDPERMQRCVALGKPLTGFDPKELICLLLMSDDLETLAAKKELRSRLMAAWSESVSRIKWSYEDAREAGDPIEEFKAWRDRVEA